MRLLLRGQAVVRARTTWITCINLQMAGFKFVHSPVSLLLSPCLPSIILPEPRSLRTEPRPILQLEPLLNI